MNGLRLLLSSVLLAATISGGPIPIDRTAPKPRPQPAAASPVVTPEPERPNVVLIVTDDQIVDGLRAMPNVIRLIASRGVIFRNSFVTTPLCCPSRASILTGQQSSHHGVFDNRFPRGGAQSFRDESTLATWLQHAGYSTALVGKYFNEYHRIAKHVPPGWTSWTGLLQPVANTFYNYEVNQDGNIVKYGERAEDYLTTVLARRAVQFIDGTGGAPFFLMFTPYSPHAPATPAPEDVRKFEDEPPRRPPSFNRRVTSGPASLLPPLTGHQIYAIDTYHRRALASLVSVDRAVADIFAAVERRGELDDTVFVFTSDNGHLLGEHRVYFKNWPYEESIRVPFLVRGPGFGEPRVDDRMVANIDIAPTIADLAGIEPGLPQDGRSIMPLLRGETSPWRSDLRLEFLGDRDGPEIPQRYDGIRTNRYKLIVWEDRSRELYDLEADPSELINLAGRPDMQAIEDVLYKRMLATVPR